jgi:hypothetical protein
LYLAQSSNYNLITIMALQKLFGISWRTTISAILVVLGGLPGLIVYAGYAGAPWTKPVLGLCGFFVLVGGAFGLGNAKDANVTGIGTKATTDTTKDATAPEGPLVPAAAVMAKGDGAPPPLPDVAAPKPSPYS